MIIPTGTFIRYQRDFDPAPKRGRVTASWEGGSMAIPDDAWVCPDPRCHAANPKADYVRESDVIDQ